MSSQRNKNYSAGFYLLLLSAFLFLPSCGPTTKEKLENIKTIEDAHRFSRENAELEPLIYKVDQSDTGYSNENIMLLSLKKNEILEMGDHLYKVIEEDTKIYMRAGYIYLSGDSLSMKEIDSLRKSIIEQFNAGRKWETLVAEYNMDTNPAANDLGWFPEKTYVPEFESAIRERKPGTELFTIDIPRFNWYYVCYKWSENMEWKISTVLKVKK
jgi:hypothetical protein